MGKRAGSNKISKSLWKIVVGGIEVVHPVWGTKKVEFTSAHKHQVVGQTSRSGLPFYLPKLPPRTSRNPPPPQERAPWGRVNKGGGGRQELAFI